MRRRDFLSKMSQAVAAATLGLAQAGRGAESNRKRPNIIFILADDLGWGDLGCYGNARLKTPNLDRLARQGVLFTQFYVNGSVCSPSRTAFMTGHYPARHRVHGHFATNELNAARGMPNWLDPAVPTIAKLLKDQGYATGHFGKWHLGSGPGAPDPSAYGFTDFRTVNSSGPGWPEEKGPYFRARSSTLIVDETIRFIEANRDKPFYVNVWSLVPHAPLHPLEEQMKPYENFGPRGLPYKGAMQIYYASVTDLDTQVGRLLAKLDELGLADNTLILFSSDNGPEDIHLGEASHSGVGSAGPFRGRKRSLYEGGIRMPGIVRWPGHVPAGRIDDTSVVCAADFLPTVCKITEIEPPDLAGLDGENVSDILMGQSRPRAKPILWEWRFNVLGDVVNRSPILAIREGDWKLLVNPDGSRKELYDIPRDRMQVNNLADRHPEIVAALADKVLAWQKTLPPGPMDPGAGKNDYPWPGEARPPQAAKKAGKKGPGKGKKK